MTPYGALRVSFSKKIRPLPFIFDSESQQKDKEPKRALYDGPPINLDDAFTMKIEDLDQEVDKSIATAQLVDIESTFFTVQIKFSDTSAISQYLIEPDTLIVTFSMPEIFVDEETGKPLASDPIHYRIPLSAQYTLEEFQELELAAE